MTLSWFKYERSNAADPRLRRQQGGNNGTDYAIGEETDLHSLATWKNGFLQQTAEMAALLQSAAPETVFLA